MQKIIYTTIFLLLTITILVLIFMITKENYNSGEHTLSADGLTNNTLKPKFIGMFTQDVLNKAITNMDYTGITLKFPENGCDSCGGSKGEVPSAEKVFTLNNGVELTFGQIMALSGDLFSAAFGPNANEGISDGNDEDVNDKNSKANRFLQAWECMNGGKMSGHGYEWCKRYGKSEDQIPNLLKNFAREIKDIAVWTAHADTLFKTGYNSDLKIGGVTLGDYGVKYPDNSVHKTPYSSAGPFSGGESLDSLYNSDTGGLPDMLVRNLEKFPAIQLLTLVQSGRMMALANYNWDHFGPGGHSAKAYFAGHLLALQTAADGDLDLAYKYDAFACHYLSDMFASGHLRTPRKELNNGKTSCAPFWIETTGNYMSKLMHDEENKGGLWVHNNLGQAWMAFGDTEFAYPVNKENRIRQKETLQASVNEVYESYKTKSVIQTKMSDYFPRADDCNGSCPWPEKGKNPEFDKIRDKKDTLSGVGKTFHLQPFCVNMDHNDEDCKKVLGPQWKYVKKDWNNCVTCERKDAFNREPMFYQDPNENGKLYARRVGANVPGFESESNVGLDCIKDPISPVIKNFSQSDKIDIPLINFGNVDPSKKRGITIPPLHFHPQS